MSNEIYIGEGEFGMIILDYDKLNVLQKAQHLTSRDRNKDYGHPRENFGDIAMMWSIYKGVEFTARDVAMMMILTKVCRDKNKPKEDNLVDIAGYARTAEMVDE